MSSSIHVASFSCACARAVRLRNCAQLRPTPDAEADDEVAEAEHGGARADEGEEPPYVPDEAVDGAASVPLEGCVRVGLGVVVCGETQHWERG